MEFVLLEVFNNYIDAHILVGRLEEEGISCWLKDENTVTINPVWTTAVGGIKLMVPISQIDRARDLVLQYKEEKESRYSCPNCGSKKIEVINSIRRPRNWILAALSVLTATYATAEKIWHCFDCNAEFEEPKESNDI